MNSGPASALRGISHNLPRMSSRSCSTQISGPSKNTAGYSISRLGFSHETAGLEPRLPYRHFSTQKRTFSSSARLAESSAIPHISLHIAAASSGKRVKYQPDRSTIDYVPGVNTDGSPRVMGIQETGNIYKRRRSRPDSGEDSYFIAPVANSSKDEIALGVCDGVGGWAEHGIDPADFSHGMCEYMARAALEGNNSTTTNSKHTNACLSPVQILESAYDTCVHDRAIRAGGTTASLALIDRNGRMRTANLGDSGFLILRSGKVQAYSTPQTHSFNTPYQMSITPPEIYTQASIFGGLPINDSPDSADTDEYMLEHGDVVVFATDGLWDNLSSQDVLNLISEQMREHGAWRKSSDRGFMVEDAIRDLVQTRGGAGDGGNVDTSGNGGRKSLQSILGTTIVGEAKIASMDRKRDGPFAKAIQREFPLDNWHGGKIDDITALIVIAVAEQGPNAVEGKLKAKL